MRVCEFVELFLESGFLKTRTDFVQRPAAVKTGLETFLKLKRTLMRNLVREIWSETGRSHPEEKSDQGLPDSTPKRIMSGKKGWHKSIIN